MYGLLIPILFFITFLGILNMYIVEKICLFYFYQAPPSYNEKLNFRVIKLLSLAPKFMFILAYWALGNRQIFFDVPLKLIFSNEQGDPSHKWFTLKYFSYYNFNLVFIFLLFFFLFKRRIK